MKAEVKQPGTHSRLLLAAAAVIVLVLFALLPRFLGLYQMLRVGDTSMRIEYRGGTLHLKDTPATTTQPVTLEPTDQPTVFTVRGGRYAGEPLTFSLADDGTVTDWLGQANGSFVDNWDVYHNNPGTNWHVQDSLL